MNLRRKGFLAAALGATLLCSGIFFYSLFAAQGQGGQLAQAPLNAHIQVTPAFIMAVDDSGSMDTEVVLPTNDGAAWWRTGDGYRSFVGLDQNNNPATGVLNFNRGGATGHDWKKYVYLFPFGLGGDGRTMGDSDHDHYAIPPIAEYGWARSAAVNRAYFDPLVSYEPWLESDGRFLQDVDGINKDTGQVSPTKAPADPKNGSTRLNLTTEWARVGNHEEFVFYYGMTIPRGTHYRVRNGQCWGSGKVEDTNKDGEAPEMASGWKVAGADRKITGNNTNSRCSIAIRFFPATFYVLDGDADAVAEKIQYDVDPVFEGTTPNGLALRRFEIREGNFSSIEDYNAAINNFANWFSYYRKRNLATRAGMSRAFATSSDTIRAGYFKINNRNTVAMRNMRKSEERKQFFNSIFSLYGTSGGTPNKEAVDHIGKQFRDRKGADAPIQLACQRNYGMLFTDGFSNTGNTSVTNNIDGDSGNKHFNHHDVFQDKQSGTMADIAAYYYSNNLRADLTEGQVPIPSQCSDSSPDPRLDCNSNPHMNFFAVALNGRGLEYGVNAAATADPYSNVPSWPTSFSDRHPSAIDDLWHATINARGALINASRPSDIAAALSQILSAVNAGPARSGSIAITGARIGPGSLQVTPSYDVQNNGTDWSGELEASVVRLGTTNEPEFVTDWRASSRLPVYSARRVFYGHAADVPRRFDASAPLTIPDLCALDGCTEFQVQALGAAATISNAINYLLGDSNLEAQNGGPFRDRSTLLGDFVNSTPVISAPGDDYGYASLGGDLGSSYRSYLETIKTSRRYMVYIGGNAGMLHAFDGGLTKDRVAQGMLPDANGGKEVFGYIPTTAVGHLGNLLFPFSSSPTARQYRHRYYVDGQIAVSDAHYGGSWKTVLVGSSGAGGRSIFALDVSNPSEFAAGDRLWEISDLNTALADDVRDDIGHVLGQPVIVPVKTRGGAVSWKAIFGNGYDSARGRGVLFLVDIEAGNPKITRVFADESSPGLAADSRNGLGNIVAVDRWGGADLNSAGADGFADTVYAADRQGALWKFDIRDASPVSQTVPLFTTQEHTGGGGKYRQPIMGGLTATVGPGGGVMIYFGTGSFSFENDHTDTNVQSLYAVNDSVRGQITQTTPLSALTRFEVGDIAGSTDRTVKLHTVGTDHGWYINLPAGERFVGNPEIASGVVFMPTYRPNPGSSGCSTSGLNALFGLNARTGHPALAQARLGSPTGVTPELDTAAIALNTGGTAPVRDVGVMAVPRQAPPALTTVPPGGSIPTPPSPPEQGCWMLVSVAGAQSMFLPYPCGRQSWRQIQ